MARPEGLRGGGPVGGRRRHLVDGSRKHRAGGQRGHLVGGRRRHTGFALAVATTAILASCDPSSGAGATGGSEAELTIRSLVVAMETADTALVQDLFWPNATYDDYPNQHTHRGVEEIVAYVTGLHRWADDVFVNVGRVHLTERGAVAEWLFSGVQARPMGSQLTVGTGNEVVLNGVTVIELEGDRIIRAADYTDTGAMLLQLGARIEMPDGGMLELGDLGN